MLQKKVVLSAQLHFISQTESQAAAKVESWEDRDVPTCSGPGGLCYQWRGTVERTGQRQARVPSAPLLTSVCSLLRE